MARSIITHDQDGKKLTVRITPLDGPVLRLPASHPEETKPLTRPPPASSLSPLEGRGDERDALGLGVHLRLGVGTSMHQSYHNFTLKTSQISSLVAF